MGGEAGGGYQYPDSEDEVRIPVKHSDHDPGLICRPALGIGLCEVLEGRDSSEEGAT